VTAGCDPVGTPDALTVVVVRVTGFKIPTNSSCWSLLKIQSVGGKGSHLYVVEHVTGVLSGMFQVVVAKPGPINESKSRWASGTGLTDLVQRYLEYFTTT
jgi:hypothetical protein